MKYFCLCAFLALGSIAPAAVITSGAASFSIGEVGQTSFDTSPAANFVFGGTSDHVFEWGWWVRAANGTAESALPAPTTINAVGNQMTLTWDSLPSGLNSVSGTLVLTLVENSVNLATLDAVFTLNNNNEVSETIDLFNMTDIDLQLTAGNDVVSGGLSGIIVTQASDARTARLTGTGASAFLVRAFSSVGPDVGGILSDAAVTNFDNSGIPFGPGDMTSGYQWALVIGAGQSAAITSRIEIALDGNLPQDPGNGIPEPSSIALLGAGLAGLAYFRRR